ncbi:DUF2512 family protein [Alkalihalobacillus pseudalcaliphilus]|uniref:DUF2512 family protein n=1 Tax=Alkalihalobacillus pseudalcaliphilus TaxID=79884 RepID=UPI00069DD65B|nr:DUF2512 family protein [Alkalihalobacillus pseudalcaliphilus]
MSYVKSFIIKWFISTVIIGVIFGFAGLNMGTILTISTILTAVAYLGDLFIMPRIGNNWATITDFFLAWAGIALLADLLTTMPIALYSFITAVLIAIAEFFYHPYLLQQMSRDQSNHQVKSMDVQTEFGEDMDVRDELERERKD